MSTSVTLVLDDIEAELLGTCDDISDVVPKELVDAVLSQIGDRNNIERCDGCSWWCELSEMNDDNLCEDCVDPDENDEN